MYLKTTNESIHCKKKNVWGSIRMLPKLSIIFIYIKGLIKYFIIIILFINAFECDQRAHMLPKWLHTINVVINNKYK